MGLDGRRRIDLSHVDRGRDVDLPRPAGSDRLRLPEPRASRRVYAPGHEFQIGVVTLCSNTGTYVDSPFHRYPDGIDMSELPLDRLADLDAVVVDAQGAGARSAPEAFAEIDVAGQAVLVRTGWHRHWRSPSTARATRS